MERAVPSSVPYISNLRALAIYIYIFMSLHRPSVTPSPFHLSPHPPFPLLALPAPPSPLSLPAPLSPHPLSIPAHASLLHSPPQRGGGERGGEEREGVRG